MHRNITLSAEESLIRKARERAAQEHKSLNSAFREWITRYAVGGNRASEYRSLMKKLSHIQSGRKFSRDEMNER